MTSAIPAQTLVLVDAARLAGTAEPVQVSITTQATLELESEPTTHAGTGSPIAPVGTDNLISLWQTDSVAIKAVLEFGFEPVRQNSVSAVFMGGSPA